MPPHSLQDQVQTLLSSFLAANYISSTLFHHSSFISCPRDCDSKQSQSSSETYKLQVIVLFISFTSIVAMEMWL